MFRHRSSGGGRASHLDRLGHNPAATAEGGCPHVSVALFECFFSSCHLERSDGFSLAKAIAQSKDPYRAFAGTVRQGIPIARLDSWGECLAAFPGARTNRRSFDSAARFAGELCCLAQDDIGS